MRGVVLALLAGLLVAGCASATDAPATTPVPTFSSGAPAPPVQAVALPELVKVPARGINGSIMPEGLGLDSSGGHAEPPVTKPMLASWYNLGPRPGQPGPAVILGHVNGGGKQGIFANLDRVKDKDTVLVGLEDGSTLSFQVYRTEKVVKTSFPTSEIYGNTDVPELRLITCGGDLDTVHHRYLSNVIVFAKLIA